MQEEILRHGSVVLGVNAGLLACHGVDGFVTADREAGDRNHAVSVIGWVTKDAHTFWVHVILGASPTCQRIVPPTFVGDAGHQRVHALQSVYGRATR